MLERSKQRWPQRQRHALGQRARAARAWRRALRAKRSSPQANSNVPQIYEYQGSCHCGAIRARLQATRPADDLEVRACQCSFCTRHGAMTVSDPAGRALIEIARAQLGEYQFATLSGVSLICRRCGSYAGAVLKDGANTWSVLNARGLAIAPILGRAATPVVYEGETAAQRIARRRRKWTPTEIRHLE
jgi:hypothetical protein